jgi:hypothetical protein
MTSQWRLAQRAMRTNSSGWVTRPQTSAPSGSSSLPKQVVAVAVRVHRRVDRVAVRDAAHRVEHRARELEVEEGVDEERPAVAGHEAGVAPAARPVGLEVAVQPVAELVQPPALRDAHDRSLPGRSATLLRELVALPEGWQSG